MLGPGEALPWSMMVKLVGLIRKRSGLTTEQFRAHWLDVHAPLARQFPGLRRYAVNFIDRDANPTAAYDGFSELWFDSEEALNAALKSPEGVTLMADLPNFVEKIEGLVVEDHLML